MAVSQELYAYLRDRAKLGSRGLRGAVAASVSLHVLALAALLVTPRESGSQEPAKVTWVTLPAAGVEGVAGGQGPMEEGKEGERQRRVEEVAPKLSEPKGYQPTPNALSLIHI